MPFISRATMKKYSAGCVPGDDCSIVALQSAATDVELSEFCVTERSQNSFEPPTVDVSLSASIQYKTYKILPWATLGILRLGRNVGARTRAQ